MPPPRVIVEEKEDAIKMKPIRLEIHNPVPEPRAALRARVAGTVAILLLTSLLSSCMVPVPQTNPSGGSDPSIEEMRIAPSYA
jgi:hypothetical protein